MGKKKPQQPQQRLCNCGEVAIVAFNGDWVCVNCFDTRFGGMTRSLSKALNTHFGMKILNPPKEDNNVEEKAPDQS